MTNFIIAPTLTMGMKAPFEGILLATTWPIGNAWSKLNLDSIDDVAHSVYVVRSSEHNEEHLSAILEALENHPYNTNFMVKEVSL